MKCCNFFFKTKWISKINNPTLQENPSLQVSSNILPISLQISVRSNDLQVLPEYIAYNKNDSLSILHSVKSERSDNK